MEIKKIVSERCPHVTILSLKTNDGSVPGNSSEQELFDTILNAPSDYVILDFALSDSLPGSFFERWMRLEEMLQPQRKQLVLCCLPLQEKEKLLSLGVYKSFMYFKDLKSALSYYSLKPNDWAEKTTICFPPALPFVPPLRQMVRHLAAHKDYTPREIFRIETIVDEICNNAIEHRNTSCDQNITMIITFSAQKMRLSISGSSNPEKLSSLKKILNQTSMFKSILNKFDAPRGRGVALVKFLSAQLSIENKENETWVHVTIN